MLKTKKVVKGKSGEAEVHAFFISNTFFQLSLGVAQLYSEADLGPLQHAGWSAL